MDIINTDLDSKQNSIKSLESFTDRYMPVRILYIMRESFAAVLNRNQMLKYENFEREKLKRIHDTLLKEETTPDIHKTIRKILTDINEVIDIYRN
jgi:hypothetical protein